MNQNRNTSPQVSSSATSTISAISSCNNLSSSNNSPRNYKKILLIMLSLVVLLVASAIKIWYFNYLEPLLSTTDANTQQTKVKVDIPTNLNNIYLLEDDGSLDVYRNSESSIDTNGVTKAFFEKYPDVYDFMAVFPAFTPSKEFNSIASTYEIQNDVRGICSEISKCFFYENCYSNRIKSLVLFTAKNNNYDELVNTPEELVYTTLHEMAHSWGVNLSYHSKLEGKLPDGINKSCTQREIPLARTDTAHWERGLVMPYHAIGAMEESMPWVDRGGGIYTYDMALYDKPRRFHPFDLYLMGLLSASQITGEFTLLTDIEDYCCDLPNSTQMGKNDFGIKAKASKVTIKDVIRITGEERRPRATSSQKNFKIAFVILIKKGQKPSENMVKTIKYISKVLPDRWLYATQNLSTINK